MITAREAFKILGTDKTDATYATLVNTPYLSQSSEA